MCHDPLQNVSRDITLICKRDGCHFKGANNDKQNFDLQEKRL